MNGLPRFVPAPVAAPLGVAGAFAPAGMPTQPAGLVVVVPSGPHTVMTSALRGTVIATSIFAGQALAGDDRWGTMVMRSVGGAVVAEITGLSIAALIRLHERNVYPVDLDWLMSYGPVAAARMVEEWRR